MLKCVPFGLVWDREEGRVYLRTNNRGRVGWNLFAKTLYCNLLQLMNEKKESMYSFFLKRTVHPVHVYDKTLKSCGQSIISQGGPQAKST